MKTKSKLLLTLGALFVLPMACQADELEECNLKANLWYQDKIDIIEFVQRQQPDYKPNQSRS